MGLDWIGTEHEVFPVNNEWLAVPIEVALERYTFFKPATPGTNVSSSISGPSHAPSNRFSVGPPLAKAAAGGREGVEEGARHAAAQAMGLTRPVGVGRGMRGEKPSSHVRSRHLHAATATAQHSHESSGKEAMP